MAILHLNSLYPLYYGCTLGSVLGSTVNTAGKSILAHVSCCMQELILIGMPSGIELSCNFNLNRQFSFLKSFYQLKLLLIVRATLGLHVSPIGIAILFNFSPYDECFYV